LPGRPPTARPRLTRCCMPGLQRLATAWGASPSLARAPAGTTPAGWRDQGGRRGPPRWVRSRFRGIRPPFRFVPQAPAAAFCQHARVLQRCCCAPRSAPAPCCLLLLPLSPAQRPRLVPSPPTGPLVARAPPPHLQVCQRLPPALCEDGQCGRGAPVQDSGEHWRRGGVGWGRATSVADASTGACPICGHLHAERTPTCTDDARGGEQQAPGGDELVAAGDGAERARVQPAQRARPARRPQAATAAPHGPLVIAGGLIYIRSDCTCAQLGQAV
jgi:hypothetical protein